MFELTEDLELTLEEIEKNVALAREAAKNAVHPDNTDVSEEATTWDDESILATDGESSPSGQRMDSADLLAKIPGVSQMISGKWVSVLVCCNNDVYPEVSLTTAGGLFLAHDD